MITAEDIETLLVSTNHPDKIRNSLSNYFEGLDENVAVAIDYRNIDRIVKPENIQSVVSLLREQGIDAVAYFDRDAAEPGKFVITESGILCPNMKPEDALKSTVYIENLMLDNGYNLLGHANPQTAKSLVYSANHKIGIESEEKISTNATATSDKAIDIKKSHPDIEEFKKIEAKYGGDYKSFIDMMVTDAYKKSEAVDFKEMSMRNVYAEGSKYLYRGGSLGNNPYATISEFNSRKIAHSSPAIEISGSFSGKGTTSSTKGGAFYPETKDNIQYGFIYELESMGDEQIYYHNVGLEEGHEPHVLSDTRRDWNGANGDIYETPVLPHHNKVHSIYLHVGKYNENRLYSIPLDENGHIIDEKWRDFFALHEPTDDKVVGYVAQRQDALKRHPEITYDFQTGKSLPEKNYTNLSDTPTEEFLRAFVRKDELSVDGKNIVCSADVKLDHLGIEKIPDLSDVHIKGKFYATDIKKVDMKNLPYTSDGYFLSNETIIENCDKIDAETFCKKVGMKYENGMWKQDDRVSNSAQYLGCPRGLSQLNLKNLNFINLTIDNIEELPTTLNGASHIKITNQNSIQNMDAHIFLQKIVGTDYDKYPNHEYNANYNIDLNLSQTNITELPKGLNSYHINRIIFPESASFISSLENIPVTKEGCYNLNFKGDLSNETMESFLLKTKKIGVQKIFQKPLTVI